ncbi:hypothetical protein EIKCOROL_00533 [Eikenella corrodens ATCC 23834]|uniref:Uncharacterized protein n=1 Tax=Eikenella corrodens ATCC 23834 TaxID=546274 RepID=C0DT56_EIKCO|nr:hypothetical protein EIKCOROL_00533 [Eikenella corrodens ATCC 23834]
MVSSQVEIKGIILIVGVYCQEGYLKVSGSLLGGFACCLT